MPRKHNRANESQVVGRKETRMYRFELREAKRGLPAKPPEIASRPGVPALSSDLSSKVVA